MLPLTVDRVDLSAGVVGLDPGTTKNNEGRSSYVTVELAKILKAQLVSIEALQENGVICSYVFHRPDGSPIKDFRKTWKTACDAAGYSDREPPAIHVTSNLTNEHVRRYRRNIIRPTTGRRHTKCAGRFCTRIAADQVAVRRLVLG